MDLHKYYKEHKDDINSSIMEIAADLATARLGVAHNLRNFHHQYRNLWTQ